MKDLNWATDTRPRSKILVFSALAAFFLEAALLTVFGWREHWLAHPQKTTGLDETQFVEAQIFQIPQEAPHLVTEKKVAPPPQKAEATLSKNPAQGTTQKANSSFEEENKTESGPKIEPTHGPVVLYAPQPVIPSYLQNREFKKSVVIDFLVNIQGVATPRLVGSSGDEELDALALAAAKKWQFRPAEEKHKPIEAKVRLRIVFQVE